jgi:16S rRNA (guanine527-N7)-methyltransferase
MCIPTFVAKTTRNSKEHVSRETLLMPDALEQLQVQCEHWGIDLDGPQLRLLDAYVDLLAGYEFANVIGSRDRDQIVLEHLVDSLSCLTAADIEWHGSLIDVGAGGGLPGVPLSIVRPDLRVTLLEATEKKVRFLEYVEAHLKLGNLKMLHARAEDASRESRYREAFDLATARALAALPVVLEYCMPLARIGGKVLAMKGRLQEEELSQGVAAARELGAKLSEMLPVDYHPQLPQKERRLVVFEKVSATPARFPRRVGIARKRPLGA